MKLVELQFHSDSLRKQYLILRTTYGFLHIKKEKLQLSLGVGGDPERRFAERRPSWECRASLTAPHTKEFGGPHPIAIILWFSPLPSHPYPSVISSMNLYSEDLLRPFHTFPLSLHSLDHRTIIQLGYSSSFLNIYTTVLCLKSFVSPLYCQDKVQTPFCDW